MEQPWNVHHAEMMMRWAGDLNFEHVIREAFGNIFNISRI